MSECVEYSEYIKDLPDRPPDGLIGWMKKQGCLKKEALIYSIAYVYNPLTEKKEKMVKVYCTACGEEYYEEYAGAECSRCGGQYGFINHKTGEAVTNGHKTTCAECGASTEVYHSGSIRSAYTMEQYFPMTVHNISGRLALVSWAVFRKITKEGIYDEIERYEAYVVDKKKIIRCTGYYKFMSSVVFLDHWEAKKKYSDQYKGTDMIFPFKKEILIGSTAENSKLDIYCGIEGEKYPVTYTRLWIAHKNVENLIMQGAAYLVNELIGGRNGYKTSYYKTSIDWRINGVNWKADKPAEMLGLTKQEYRTIVREEKRPAKHIEFYKTIQELTGEKLDKNEIGKCEKVGFNTCKKIAKNWPIKKPLMYVDKQNMRTEGKVTLIELIDYWDMATKLNKDICDSSVAFPKNLKIAHAQACKQIEWKENKAMSEKFKRRYKALDSFKFEDDETGLIVRPAKSQKELIKEGEMLHHCVARYANDHANGRTAIFFIRKIKAPEIPFFTLELDEKNGAVRQNRGMRNRDRTPEVMNFEKKFIEHIKEIMEDESNGKSNGKHSKCGIA